MSERSVGLRVGFSSPAGTEMDRKAVHFCYQHKLSSVYSGGGAITIWTGCAPRQQTRPVSSGILHRAGEEDCLWGPCVYCKPPAIFRNTEQRKSGDEEYLKGKP